MTTTFADATARWCNLSARLLGWRPGEFWQATPAELAMALADPIDPVVPVPPSRDLIAQMMEHDARE